MGRGGWHFSHLVFQGLSLLHLEIVFAKLCYTSEEKLFFLSPYFFEHSSSNLSKNKPLCMCKKCWFVGLR